MAGQWAVAAGQHGQADRQPDQARPCARDTHVSPGLAGRPTGYKAGRGGRESPAVRRARRRRSRHETQEIGRDRGVRWRSAPEQVSRRPIRSARDRRGCRVRQRRRTGQTRPPGRGPLPPPGHRGDIDGIVPVGPPPWPPVRVGLPVVADRGNGGRRAGVDRGLALSRTSASHVSPGRSAKTRQPRTSEVMRSTSPPSQTIEPDGDRVLAVGDDRPVRPGVLPALQDRHRSASPDHHRAAVDLVITDTAAEPTRHDQSAPVPAALTLKGVTLT